MHTSFTIHSGHRENGVTLTDHLKMRFGAVAADDTAGGPDQTEVEVGAHLVAGPQTFGPWSQAKARSTTHLDSPTATRRRAGLHDPHRSPAVAQPLQRQVARARRAGRAARGRPVRDLKHFCASRSGADGEYDPKTVQALSRHAEFSETSDTHAHPPVAVLV